MDQRQDSDARFMINVPVNGEELAYITARADEDSMSVQDYVRACILPGQLDPVEVLTTRLRTRTLRTP